MEMSLGLCSRGVIEFGREHTVCANASALVSAANLVVVSGALAPIVIAFLVIFLSWYHRMNDILLRIEGEPANLNIYYIYGVISRSEGCGKHCVLLCGSLAALPIAHERYTRAVRGLVQGH